MIIHRHSEMSQTQNTITDAECFVLNLNLTDSGTSFGFELLMQGLVLLFDTESTLKSFLLLNTFGLDFFINEVPFGSCSRLGLQIIFNNFSDCVLIHREFLGCLPNGLDWIALNLPYDYSNKP